MNDKNSAEDQTYGKDGSQKNTASYVLTIALFLLVYEGMKFLVGAGLRPLGSLSQVTLGLYVYDIIFLCFVVYIVKKTTKVSVKAAIYHVGKVIGVLYFIFLLGGGIFYYFVYS